MEPYSRIFYFIGDLIIPLAVGFCLRHRKSLDNKFNSIIKLNIFLIVPALNLLVFWSRSLAMTMVWLPIIGAVMHFLPGAIALTRVKKLFEHPYDRGAYLLSAIFSNRSAIGILTVYSIYGEEGYQAGRLVMLFGGFTFYFFGFAMAGYFQKKGETGSVNNKGILSVIFNKNQIPVLGIICGIMLNFYGVFRPAWGAYISDILLHLSMWCFILPVGYGMEIDEIRNRWRTVVGLAPVRFVITPAVVYLLSRLAGLSGVSLGATVILSFAPSAVQAVVAAKIFGLNRHIAMAAFIVTSVIYLVAVLPLILLFTVFFPALL